MSSRRTRNISLPAWLNWQVYAVAAALVVVLVIGVVALPRLINPVNTGAEAAVRTYMQLLEQGKYEAATAAVPVKIPGDTGVNLLKSQAAEGAEGKLKLVSVSTGMVSGDTTAITVRYIVGDGAPQQAVVSVKPSKVERPFIGKWAITTSLARSVDISIPSAVNRVTVGTISVPLPLVGADKNGYRHVKALAYPGSYSLIFGTVNPKYLTAGLAVTPTGQRELVVTESQHEATLSVNPTAELSQWALSWAQEQVRACAEGSGGDACPAQVRNVDASQLTLQSLPSRLLEIDGDKFSAVGVIRVSGLSSRDNGVQVSVRIDATYTFDAAGNPQAQLIFQ